MKTFDNTKLRQGAGPKSSWARYQQAHGFTLIEMMIVIAVLAILIAAAVPTRNAYLENHGPQYAADELYGDIQLCRLRAARNNQRCRIDFNPPAAAGALPDQWTLTDVDNNGAIIGVFKTGTLSKYRHGVAFTNSPRAIDPPPFATVEFLPRGILNLNSTAPIGSNSIYLTNQDNYIFYRILVSLAGGTSVDRWNSTTAQWR